jgi:hypothetical protein
MILRIASHEDRRNKNEPPAILFHLKNLFAFSGCNQAE